MPDGRRAILAAGDGTFIDLWQPGPGNAESLAFRETRGQGPYELVFETPALEALTARLSSLRVPVSGVSQHREWRSAGVDLTSANGARMRIVEVAPGANSWPLAGESWATAPQPSTLRLRQIAVLVRELDDALSRWGEMFGLRATQRFQVSFTDLEIAVIPLLGKDTFIELAQPTGPDASSQRFLNRYREGLYLTIYEIPTPSPQTPIW